MSIRQASAQRVSRRAFLHAAVVWGSAALFAACAPRRTPLVPVEGAQRRVRLLYTNDEHGWMEVDPHIESGGAVSLLQRWTADEGVTPGGPFLILSGGDLFTGPALSSVNHGEAMVDVMNAIGYHAAAVGNHDLDYGVENLRQRAAQANFPLLSANLRLRSSGETPDFIQPFTIQEVNGIKFGLVGLTTTETAVDTRPEAVADFVFLPYAEALQEALPLLKDAGAQVMVVLGHICTSEMEALAGKAQELGIAVLCGGHCHEVTNHAGVSPVRVQAGSYLRGYIRMDLAYDTETGQLSAPFVEYVENPPGKTDRMLAELVQGWREKTDPALWQPIGYLGKKIDNRSPEMGRLLAAAWLDAYPQAQIALASPRYIHSIPAGEMTLATILSTWPTENTIVHLRLTGQQVQDTLAERQPVAGGSVDLDALDPGAVYDVLVPDTLYAGGNYYRLNSFDHDGINTGIAWRDPVAAWITKLATDRSQPLEKYLAEF